MHYHDSTPPSVAISGGLDLETSSFPYSQPDPKPTLLTSTSKSIGLARNFPSQIRIVLRIRYRKTALLTDTYKSTRMLFGIASMVLLVIGLFSLTQRGFNYLAYVEIQQFNRSTIFQSASAPSSLPQTTAFRAEMAGEAVSRIDKLTTSLLSNERFDREAAIAYRKIAEVQGYGNFSNHGDWSGAIENLKKSVALLEPLAIGSIQPDTSTELAVSLERLANVLSLAGRYDQARVAAKQSIATLAKLEKTGHELELATAWQTLSSIEQQAGKKQDSLNAALASVQFAASLPGEKIEERARAYEQLAQAISLAEGPTQRALDAAKTAVTFYGTQGEGCSYKTECRASYLEALKTLSQMHSLAGHHPEVLTLAQTGSAEVLELVSRDPNNHFLLSQLRQRQYLEAVALQATNRIPQALAKFKEAINTGTQLTSSGAVSANLSCPLIQARVRYASLLAQSSPQSTNAQEEWAEARKLLETADTNGKLCINTNEVPKLGPFLKTQLRAGPVASHRSFTTLESGRLASNQESTGFRATSTPE